MSKKLHLNLRFPSQEVALFRIFMENLNLDEEGEPTQYPLGVEIVYEEECEAGPLFPAGVAFDLWFAEPRDAYYFALRLKEAREAWASMAAHAAEQATYPKFFYLARLGTFLRYNSPEYFCLVSGSQLQVRRERPQELFRPEEVVAVDEEFFLAAYHDVLEVMRVRATQGATYQRRGAPGNEWFYCNPLPVGSQLPQHVRLNRSQHEHGNSWQLMWAHDTNRYDTRRVVSTSEQFEQQLELMLADVEAAATGKQEGGLNG